MPEMMTSIHRFEKPNTSQLQEMSHYSKTSQHQRQRDGVKEAREKRWKDKLKSERKYLKTTTSDIELVSGRYKTLSKYNNKKTSSPIMKWAKGTDTFHWGERYTDGKSPH